MAQHSVVAPKVKRKKCVGCGICESKCVVKGRPAVRVIAAGETRSVRNQIMLDDVLKTRIDNEIASESVVLFMKGTPVFPQCGFSAAVVGVLSHL